ncbi:MAG: universal stress protein [Balneolaceae bacterium]
MKAKPTILLPTDFSEGAASVFPIAQKLATLFGATVDVLHVIPTVTYWNESLKTIGLPVDPEADLYPKVAIRAEQELDRLAGEHLDDKVRGKTLVRIDRKPSAAIADQAKKGAYDLIVIGAKGKDGTGLFRGSTTQQVIRSSMVPVFVIDNGFQLPSIQHIVLPTDTSLLSLAPLPVVLDLADTFNASITMLFIAEIPGTLFEQVPHNDGRIRTDLIRDTILTQTERMLKMTPAMEWKLTASSDGQRSRFERTDGDTTRQIELKVRVKQGFSVANEIENFSKDHADLVAIATHGRSGLSHMIIGSIAERVALHAQVPVLTYRPDKNLFAEHHAMLDIAESKRL